MTKYVTSGTVAFSDTREHEIYDGKSTGKYSIVLTMDDMEASVLEDMGVRVKQYEGTPQRKFNSKYTFAVIDMDEAPFEEEIPYGSKVRVQWKLGNVHPTWGPSTYIDKIKVVERAEPEPIEDSKDSEEF